MLAFMLNDRDSLSMLDQSEELKITTNSYDSYNYKRTKLIGYIIKLARTRKTNKIVINTMSQLSAKNDKAARRGAILEYYY